MKCRHCQAPLDLTFVDLGSAPPSNAYLTVETLDAPERWFPLRVMTCTNCWLVQTADFARADELFDAEYAYFSGFSQSWLRHSKRYVEAMIERFGLGPDRHVVEVAANDGYLLQYVAARGVPCTGIEPTASTAAAARAKGLAIVEDFFGRELASRLADEGKQADVMTANNVLAHVPDINDFVGGFAIMLKPGGVATFEFPHLLRLIDETQFDTIYHEHFSYLSLIAVERIFRENGLTVFDVEELPTHGGSLRVYAARTNGLSQSIAPTVAELLGRERAAGLDSAAAYQGFQARAESIKRAFLSFLIEAKEAGKTVAGYGAAAKGNTLINFAGVRSDLIAFVCDANPAKQGKFLPGSRIPIRDPGEIERQRPDYVIVLPWNLADELAAQLAPIRQWDGRIATAIPELRVR